MNRTEAAALRHAAEWLRYQRSAQARRDREADTAQRAKADAAAGHLPACGLLRCCPVCPTLRCE